METSQVTCRTLETFYHINAHTFEKQYKEILRVFRVVFHRVCLNQVDLTPNRVLEFSRILALY